MYTDLSSTRLYIRLRVVQADGKALSTTEPTVSPVNMFFHALWSKVDVYVCETMITQSTGTYPWKAGLETVLSFGPAAKKSQLQSIMYYKDNPGTDPDVQDPNTQSGAKGTHVRHNLIKDSDSVEMYGPLHVDLFSQPKYLLPLVPIRIRLYTSSPEFSLMCTNSAAKLKVEIQEASLWIRRVQVSPQVELAHARTLAMGHNARYPVRRGIVEQVSIGVGQRTITKDQFFGGKVPVRMVMVMMGNEAVHGSLTHSPWNFQHFDLQTLELSLNNEPVSGTPMALDFTKGLYMRAYNAMFHFLHRDYQDSGLDIGYNDFCKGYTILCFDLTADGCGNCTDHLEVQRDGNLSIKLSFAKALTSTVNLYLYGEFESTLEITKSREVLLDYKR
jgi:hypothetical protein